MFQSRLIFKVQRVKVRFNRTVPWHPLLQVEEQPSAMVMELDNVIIYHIAYHRLKRDLFKRCPYG